MVEGGGGEGKKVEEEGVTALVSIISALADIAARRALEA